MKRAWFIEITISFCILSAAVFGVFAQADNSRQAKNQEVSGGDKTSVLIMRLPDWENTRSRASYILNTDDLRKSLGERPVFDLIKFEGGTEAAAAPYNQGKLLIVEYPTPQASIDADAQITQRLNEIGQNPPIFYRRIGNYNAFVFDAPDAASANALLDQVKYEKTVQWLGENPYIQQQIEREFAIGIGDVFLSTLIFVLAGLGVMLVAGTTVGLIFYYIREQKRASMPVFSDAGGMIRLNLDGLTSPTSTGRLLNQ